MQLENQQNQLGTETIRTAHCPKFVLNATSSHARSTSRGQRPHQSHKRAEPRSVFLRAVVFTLHQDYTGGSFLRILCSPRQVLTTNGLLPDRNENVSSQKYCDKFFERPG
jgi:hypothetical protein